MIPTAAYELLADIFTGESSDTLTKLSIGYGTAAETLTDTGLDDVFTDHGFEQATVTGSYASGVLSFSHTFTNTDTVSRTITECGLFSDAGVLIYRRRFIDSELPNFGIIPAGKAITISVYLTFSDTIVALGIEMFFQDPVYYQSFSSTIYVVGSTSSVMDLTTFDGTSEVYYNGISLPNAGIPKFNEALGAKSWEFTCYTQDYTLLNNILRYAGPLTTGSSITGRQYVISTYRAGCLALKNMTTLSMDKYSNCYIQGPIQVTPFGLGWWFDVKVLQSAYGEQ